ncbi:MAG TPA: PD-(D/E)XK nuclease family protein [Oscillatoriales cyanobacterium M59_W2019_021]|nr:PD-(D/E)XK nuclease family protein [Oscillatoriales cyanobacterium M4454_W2019_049]HIK52684.1 PD-(D/E)XK nuclease family protein [Oscillatoriales cyanobacterium M59_W2019_021]
MVYHLSATKLQEYHRCPRAYYFKYERGLKTPTFFRAPLLGRALHAALAKIYWDWHYGEPKPPIDWIRTCWERCHSELSPELRDYGLEILENYYYEFIATLTKLRRPVAVEGRISSQLPFCQVNFRISGRYDRLDWLDDEGLELIDYKSNQTVKPFDPDEIDLQLGLYYLALEQRYRKSLKRLTLLYILVGEEVTFEATSQHRENAIATIGELATQLRTDLEWEPCPGDHCRHCSYARYCSAVTDNPEPLPENTTDRPPLQLALDLNPN